MTEEELKALLIEGAQAGVLEMEERDMIERVLRLADKPVRAIMTPRTELAWIDRTDPPKDIAAALKAAPHSRFVVCDGSVDNVVGVVQAKDLLDRILSGGDLSLSAALRQPIVVPDTVTRAGRSGTTEVRHAGPCAGDGRIRQLRGRGDRGRRVARRSSATPADAGASGRRARTAKARPRCVIDGMMPVDELKARLSPARSAGRRQLSHSGRSAAGAAAAGAAGGRPHRVRRLAVRGAGDGRPPCRQGAGRPRTGGGDGGSRAPMTNATVTQCAVLVGGLGTRLGALTATTPKPFLPCGDRPFLFWLLREFVRFGVTDFLLLTGHLSRRDRARGRRNRGRRCPARLRITLSEEPVRAGTGGAVFHARDLLQDRFLLCNGNSLFDCNLANVAR